MEKLKVKSVVISKQEEDSQNYQDFFKLVKKKKINVIQVKAGDQITIEKNLIFQILWPTPDHPITENVLNNNSIVAKLVYKNFSMLFTGDIEELAENAILNKYSNNKKILKSTVIKIAHHGSKTSSTEDFLEAVSPQYAFIGVGKNNTFGHPSEVTINRLKEMNTKIHRTDLNGEIILTIKAKKIHIKDTINLQ